MAHSHTHSYTEDTQNIIVRLKRMEGQLKGIRKMVENGEYCVDILNQLSSIMAATQKVANIIMKDHIKGCVRDALTRNENSEEKVDELVSVVEKFTKR
jgi:DNA-binding FrmR family transcriptional regulator